MKRKENFLLLRVVGAGKNITTMPQYFHTDMKMGFNTVNVSDFQGKGAFSGFVMLNKPYLWNPFFPEVVFQLTGGCEHDGSFDTGQAGIVHLCLFKVT